MWLLIDNYRINLFKEETKERENLIPCPFEMFFPLFPKSEEERTLEKKVVSSLG